MSVRVKIKVPPPKKGLEPKIEEVLFRDDETAKTVIEYVIKQFGLNAEKGYKLFFPRFGIYIKKSLTLSMSQVKDEDHLEVHLKKHVDKINVFNTPIETLKMGNLDSMRTSMRTMKAEINEPLYKIIPNLIFLFKLNGKDEYTLRKVTVRAEDGAITKVGKYLNVNLSLKENNIKRNGYICLEPMSSEKLYEVVAKNPIRKEGWLSKNSKKGDGKVTGLKKRWAVLQDNFLYYFEKAKAGIKASGVIDVEFMILSKEGQTEIKLELIKYSFRTTQLVYTLVCENEKERNEWFAALRHHCANGDYRRVFGVPLEKLMKLPTKTLSVVSKTINALDKRGLDTEGLFRTPGNAQKIELYKEEFNLGKDPDLSEADPHTCVGLLKTFLKELPEPLLTFGLYRKFLGAENISQLQECVSALPNANQLLLELLLFFFGRVIDHKPKNGVDSTALGFSHHRNFSDFLRYTFAPTFLQSPKEDSVQNIMTDQTQQQRVMKMLIENRYAIKFAKIRGKKKMNLKNRVQVRALYDYASQGRKNQKGETDLGFKKGEVMVILEEPPGSSWYKVKKGSEEGLVPNNYVEKIDLGELKISKISKKSSSSSKGTVRDRKSKKLDSSKESSSRTSNVFASPPTTSSKSDLTSSSKSDLTSSTKSEKSEPTPPVSILKTPSRGSLLPADDWKQKYEVEVQKRMALEDELASVKSELEQYRMQYGPLFYDDSSNDIRPLPPPPEVYGLPPPPELLIPPMSDLPPPPV